MAKIYGTHGAKNCYTKNCSLGHDSAKSDLLASAIKKQDFTQFAGILSTDLSRVSSSAKSSDESGKDALLVEIRKAEAERLAKAAVPRKRKQAFADYYTATDRKHFGDASGPGSKFTDPELKKVEDVVALAAYQRGSLDGDDTQKFISRGANPDAFQEGKRYLMVQTPGKVGIMHSAGVSDDETVEVVRTKPGVPCSLVYTVDEQPETNYGVVVMVEDVETGKDMVITTFPGVVTKSLKNDEIDSLEGRRISVSEVRRILGSEVWFNTKLLK